MRLKQKFTRDTVGQELNIEMTISNVSGGPISTVAMNRYVYFDVDSSYPSRVRSFRATAHSVLGTWTTIEHGFDARPNGLL